jgi:hypothetical protein
VVLDDNSSTENLLRWNFEKALTAGLIDVIPRMKGGKKKQDNRVN